MDKKAILIGFTGVLIGLLLSGSVAGYSVNQNRPGLMRMYGINTANVGHGAMSMDYPDSSMGIDSMVGSLKSKTGEDFDKTFLSDMISHHQGAIEMANLALKNAKHDELKTLANDIVSAQSKEITQMKAWQQQWGYSTSEKSGDNGMMEMHP